MLAPGKGFILSILISILLPDICTGKKDQWEKYRLDGVGNFLNFELIISQQLNQLKIHKVYYRIIFNITVREVSNPILDMRIPFVFCPSVCDAKDTSTVPIHMDPTFLN